MQDLFYTALGKRTCQNKMKKINFLKFPECLA